MLPTDPTHQYQNEIDIIEILGGYPENMYQSYHYGADRNQTFRANKELQNNGKCPMRDFSEGWTRFGVDWQPDHIAWYINGVKCGEFTDSALIPNGPMQLILNMMVDNSWERDWNSLLADQTLVNQLEVDYIRVYQQQ
jgi:beta-glucanase (GH16 family)